MPNNKKPPSQQAVIEYIANKPQSGGKVLRTFISRSVLIAIGLKILSKDPENAIDNALIASAVIETYLLWWYRNGNK